MKLRNASASERREIGEEQQDQSRRRKADARKRFDPRLAARRAARGGALAERLPHVISGPPHRGAARGCSAAPVFGLGRDVDTPAASSKTWQSRGSKASVACPSQAVGSRARCATLQSTALRLGAAEVEMQDAFGAEIFAPAEAREQQAVARAARRDRRDRFRTHADASAQRLPDACDRDRQRSGRAARHGRRADACRQQVDRRDCR